MGTGSISGELPYDLALTAGAVDGDPVLFAYAGYAWSSSDGCSVGGCESGDRDMDCGFNC